MMLRKPPSKTVAEWDRLWKDRYLKNAAKWKQHIDELHLVEVQDKSWMAFDWLEANNMKFKWAWSTYQDSIFFGFYEEEDKVLFALKWA